MEMEHKQDSKGPGKRDKQGRPGKHIELEVASRLRAMWSGDV